MKPAPIQWTDNGIEPPPVQYGPDLPVAYCRCDTRLSWERDWRGQGWRCHCEGCIDGETFSDGTTAIYVNAGEGVSPWEALEDLANVRFDRDPEDLLVEGWWKLPEVSP